MSIEPTNIRRSMFRNAFRGYDANQVDDFLDTVLDEFRRTHNETQRMREEADRLRERLQQFEDLEGSIRAALVQAEQAANDLGRSANREAENVRQGARREAEDVRQSARREAEAVRQSARREAELTVKDAQARSHRMLADSASRIERVQDSYEALQDAKRSFADDLRHLLKTYMEMVENMEVSSAREIEAAAQEEPSGYATDEATFYDGQTVSGHGIVGSAEEAAPADEAVVGDPGATRRIEAEPAGASQATGAPRSMASPGPEADFHPEADPQEQEHPSGRVVPRLAEGIELVGEYKGSGSSKAQYLVRRADGQFVHLSRLLYLVAEAVDGRRDLGQIAERVSQEFGRGVTADNVQFLAQKRLAPLGVVATATEGFEPPRYKDAVLGLNYRLGVVPAGVVRAIAAPFLPLFWPPVVAAVLCGLVALDVWIVFVHGAGQGLLDIIYQPSLLFLFFALELVAMVWHECGHATACRYGGARPGKVGVGLYIVWFVLFCDVTDSYRLDKVGRLRTDCGGLYFDAIFSLAIVGAYFLTGFEPLLALALLNQLAALDELSPFVRFDGYYIVSDLTGVPNLYQYIPPVVKGLIPGRETDESVKALKPWVRAIITVWVLATVPVLLFGLVMLFYLGPRALAAAWDSFLIHYGEVLGALEGGSTIAGVMGVINILALLGPVVGGILIAAFVIRRLIVAAWRWFLPSQAPTSARDGGLPLAAGGSTAEHRGEGATTTRQGWSAPRSRYAVYVAGVLVAAVGLGVGASLVAGGQSEQNPAGGGPTGSETPQDTVTEPDDGAGSTNAEEPAKGVPFVHVATDENSRGNYTYLSDPAIDGDPNAVVLVVSADRGSDGAATYGHNIGVWYEPGAQKWAIFNQDRSAVPAGAAFRVVLPPASGSFVHRAELDNTVGNATYLDDPLTNGRPGAVLSVTQNWNPGGGAGVYNDHPAGDVFYDEDVDKWAIYNRDGAPMPGGAAFNVAVSGSDEGAS